ncbi:MAG: altronate dehydratase family protein [Treponema sp.]|nr:altronate dehydratase family protein [Treponema sp.]
MSEKQAIRINPADSVAVALQPLSKGTVITLEAQESAPEIHVTLAEDITAGHKFALKDIAPEEPVIKYGYPIGAAKEKIAVGHWVHTHNIHTLLSGELDYVYDEAKAKAAYESWYSDTEKLRKNVPFVNVYKRPDGHVGIRNELWIVPTVGCVNKLSELLAAWGNGEFCGGKPGPREDGGIEGVFTWTHPYGCSQMGGDKETTAKILADLVHQPNAGGILVLSLGCEENNIPYFKQFLGDYDEQKVKFLVTQDYEDEIAEGRKLLSELAAYAGSFKREKAPLSEIVLGMKCGGSDGMSGITANALVGRVCDALTAMGGTVMLTEVPEMFGAEQMLMNRCINKEVFDKTVHLINGFKDYYARHNQVCYENPSPGNKAGGITTLEDKSLGCVQKGGKAPVCDVLRYGERVHTKGLNLLEGPGNDIVSTTAMTASGANMILFTTGRGNPMGAPVPTVKVATNHPLAQKKHGWIDFDAAQVLENGFEDTRDAMIQYICDVASGKAMTKNESNGYREIAIFKDGVTL